MQFFLSGWIDATPGDGVCRLRMPDNVEGAHFDFHLHDPDDAEFITIDGAVSTEPIIDENDPDRERVIGQRCTAVVSWSNTTYRNVPFDYDVAPYMPIQRPPEMS